MRASRSIVILVALGFVGLLVYGVVAKAPDTTIDDAIAQGKTAPAPKFSLEVLERGQVEGELARVFDDAARDGTVDLGELGGTPIALNFWASWCDPCRTEAPILERGWEAAQRAGVLVLGLDQQDLSGKGRAFIDEFRLTYPNVREGDKETARRYGATGLPETFFIDKRGMVVAHVIGALSDEQMRKGIEAARTSRPVVLGLGGARQSSR